MSSPRAPRPSRSAGRPRPEKKPGPGRPLVTLNAPPLISATEERLLTRMAWAVTALVAVALLIVALGPHRMGDDLAETDFYGAYAAGARLVQHGTLDPSRYSVIGPGYEIALGLAGFVVPDLLTAAELLSVLAAVGTLLLWFYLLRRRVGARVALGAILFLATNAVFFRHGYGALTDAPAMVLQAAALTALLVGTRPRTVLLAGVLAALAFLTRYNAIYLLPAGLIALLGGGALVERRGRAALLFTAGFLTPVVPWVIYSIAQGSGFAFQLHHNIAYEVFARSRDITWDAYQATMQSEFKNLWDVIAKDPGAVANRMLFNVTDHLRLDAVQLMGWPVAVCALLGVGFGLRDGSLLRLWPVVVAGGLLYATLVPVFYSVRYSLPLAPLYATLAGIAFASPLAAFGLGTARRFWIKPALAALPLAAALTTSVRAQAFVLEHLPIEALECAKTLDRLEAPGDRVIARKGHLAYHAGIEPVAFPFAGSLPELAAYARESRARWLFFSYREADSRPRFAYLLDTAAVVPGLVPRAVYRPRPAVLYEIGAEFGKTPAWLSNDTLYTWHTTRARSMVEGDNARVFFNLGGVAQLLGHHEEARAALEHGVRLDPENPAALLLLGSVLVELGDGAAARGAYQRAAMLLPGSVEPKLGLGWASLAEGKIQEAAKEWRPLIKATRDAKTLERMVTLYGSLGEKTAEAEAVAALRAMRSGS